ncbi:hypothetical protein Nepgr_031285 [Nepenthes gracilis]|uniref:Peptidase C14 caspase domain-containing protein n=1 Tax=Nepenthes gracilis TaxID=150966 RepID=A0AAD3Y4N5_NEPGR|nr:hypothetical protein Nepgr_031285 [Nepenthes gracilis]
MEGGAKRLAVLVGCNYPDTEYELQGCINDVLEMRDLLVERFRFDPNDIEMLTDEPGGSAIIPTGANIKKALERMVDRAEEGDVLYFHYSGHGTLIPSLNPDDPSRKDEAIVPCDFNLITDMDFRQLVNCLPGKSSFTILSDSCHSGGLIDQRKGANRTFHKARKGKNTPWIPFFSPKDDPHRLHYPKAQAANQHGNHQHRYSLKSALQRRRQPPVPTNETSADVNMEDEGGKAYGAFSNAVRTVLKEESGAVSNREIVIRARMVLQEQGFRQHPCLYCSDENGNAPFLLQPIPKEDSSA